MLFIIFIGSYWWGSLKNNFTREKFIFVLGNSYNRKTTCCILCTNDKNSWLPQGRLWGVLPAWICLLVLWHALYQNNFLIFYYILYFLFSSLFRVKNDNAFHLELMKIKCPIHSSLIESQLHIKKSYVVFSSILTWYCFKIYCQNEILTQCKHCPVTQKLPLYVKLSQA